MSWAKGIAGGFPLGAIWVSDRPVTLMDGTTKPLCNLLGPGTHGTTFGGTPLVCAGANEVLSVIEDERMLENASAMGAHAIAQVLALHSPLIKEVRGVGLLVGIEFATDFADRVKGFPPGKAPCLYMVERLHEAGVLTIPSGTHAMRWLPPLNVARAEIDEGVSILGSVLASLT
jgi:acetylornithine/N-succinyldiaminopimelate aminotransferase